MYDKSEEFALRIIKLFKHLQNNAKEYILSKQILRSGTSIGANLNEARGAESTRDYIHKLHISFKETYETQYWLRLLHKSDYLSAKQFELLDFACTDLRNQIARTLISQKKKLVK
jgi:four helix bundle protein